MTIDKKYYPYLIGGFVIVLIGVMGLFSLFPKRSQDIPKFPQNNEVSLTIQSADRKSISFSLTNNTSYTIGFWPDTCASQTVELMTVKNGTYYPTFAKPEIMCLMMPSLSGINPGGTYGGTYSPVSGNTIPAGTYVLKAIYGPFSDPYALESSKEVYSEIFTVR